MYVYVCNFSLLIYVNIQIYMCIYMCVCICIYIYAGSHEWRYPNSWMVYFIDSPSISGCFRGTHLSRNLQDIIFMGASGAT